MQQESKQLKHVRDKMEEIQQDLESMRDNIAKWSTTITYNDTYATTTIILCIV